MNIREGARRIQLIGRYLLSFAGILIALGVVTAIVLHFIPLLQGNNYINLAGFVTIMAAISVYLAIPGFALLLLGWIVDGFAKPSDP